LLVGREGLENGEIKNDEDGIEIANCENFFFINYIDPDAVSPHSANFVINITTAETANTY
jgi:hypothetical protein